jgi:predicted DNA-binding transcriptional regulator AlpA
MSERLQEQITRICERARQELELLIASQPPPVPIATASTEWMSATQLAEYWHLHNDKGEPTVAGIIKWAKRPPNQFPLPHAYMGDLLRFHRDEVNQWAREEAERRRVHSERRRLKIA